MRSGREFPYLRLVETIAYWQMTEDQEGSISGAPVAGGRNGKMEGSCGDGAKGGYLRRTLCRLGLYT